MSRARRREGSLDLAASLLCVLLGGLLWDLGRGPGPALEGVSCPVPVELDGRLDCEGDTLGLRAGDALHEGRRARMAPAWIEALQLDVDVNRASEAELATLRGVGPVLARRIVEGRPYRDLVELDEVRGIGPKKLAAIAPRLRFGPMN